MQKETNHDGATVVSHGTPDPDRVYTAITRMAKARKGDEENAA